MTAWDRIVGVGANAPNGTGLLRTLLRASTLALVLLALAAGPAVAQEDGRITGRIVDQDGEGLEGVVVTLNEASRAEITNAGGDYTFNAVAAGTYSLTFTLGDSATTETDVVVTAGETTRVDTQVAWDVSFADSVTVFSASRRPERIVEAPAAVTVITEEEVEREASHGQLPKLLEFTPGAEVSQSGLYDFNFNTRGFNSSLNRRIVTLIDGRDPSVPFLGAQEWAAISFPLDDLANVELVRGPSSALYGANAFNGVLNMVTKQPRYSEGGMVRLTGGELSSVNVDARLAGELGGNWYYKLLGGYRASDDFTQSRNRSVEYPGLPREAIPLVIEDDNEIAFGGLRFDNYLDNGHVLTAEGGYAEIQGPAFQTGIGRVQLLDIERPWARLNYNTSHLNFLGYWNGRDGEQRSLLSGAPLFLDSSNYTLEAQGNTDLFGGRARVIGGLSYSEEEIETDDPFGRPTLTFGDIEEDYQAAFAQVEFDLSDSVRLVLAGRYDESSVHESQFSPKGSVVWALNPNNSLRFTYNEAFQVANYSEFFLRARTTLPGTTISSIDLSALEAALGPFLGGVSLGFGDIPVLALGNEDLDLEEIETWEVGYTGVINNRGLLTVDYYNSESQNFISDLLPNLGATGRLNGNFGAYAPPSQLPAQVRQIILLQLANLAATNPLLGQVLPFLSNAPDGSPILALATYTNFGTVESQGVEVGFNYRIGEPWGVNFAYSWFDFEIVDSGGLSADQLQPNAPEHSFSLGLTYSADRWDAGIDYRWVDDFRWIVGPFNGTVPSYDVVNLTGNWQVTDRVSLGLNVSNLFDDEHYQTFGGDVLGRRALGSVTFGW